MKENKAFGAGLKVRLHRVIRGPHDGKVYTVQKIERIRGWDAPVVTLEEAEGPFDIRCIRPLSKEERKAT